MRLFTRAPAKPSLSTLTDTESLRDFVQRIDTAIYVTNTRGRILDGNPAFFEMLGVSSLHHLCAYSAADLLADPTQRREEQELLQRNGFVREFELKIRRPDGQLRIVLDTAYLCTDPRTGETLCRGILVDITQRKSLERQLVDQNIRDALTGCYNRRWISRFEQRMQVPGWGCIVVDVDHFKQYNDTYGHDAGDAALVKVSHTLLQHARAEDCVVRLGGDEFAVLLEGSIPITTQQIGERMRQVGSSECAVPFSIGWATREGSEALEATLTRADQNMYAGRRRVRGPERPR